VVVAEHAICRRGRGGIELIRRDFLALAASAAAFPFPSLRAQAPGAAPPGPRPIEDFASLPFMQGPELSPDGTRVAAKMAIGGEQFFSVHSLFGDAPPRLVRSGGGDINWWRWVNNDWLIVGIGALDHVEDTDFYVRRTMGISADGKKIVPLGFNEAAQGADDVIWVANDGSPRIRLALQKSIYVNEPGFWPEVREFDVSTGHWKLVVEPHDEVESWYADGTGAVRVGIRREQEGRASSLLYRRRDGDNFHVVDRANSRKGQSLLLPALFLDEPDQALAIDDHDGYDALYKLDLATMTIGERVFGLAGYDIDGIVTDSAGTKLLGIATVEEGPRTHWLDPDLAKLQTEVEKVTPGRRPDVLSMDSKRQRFLIHLGAPDRPGIVYYMDAEDGRMQRLAYANSRIGAGVLNPVRTVRYKAKDGLEIAAILTLPAGREAKNLPVVVMPHGGPFARDSEAWDWWAQSLAERGYAVIQPNYRGSSGYGKAFAQKGEGQWGLAMQDDLNDALAWLAREGIGDSKRAAMVGASYGGYAAMRAAQRDGALYRCAISFAGVSDLPALLRYDSQFLNSGRGTDWVRAQAPDLRSVSPVNFPEQFSTPILLVHGKVDQRVPVKQSRELADRLTKAGKKVTYIEQPKGDHHLSRQEDRLALLKASDDFLNQHNPA
jgi:dipeptidyl aminopeptidase/acylaminoacyl peptidase